MNDDLLQIEKLNVEYITDDAIVYALNDFSLNVKRGEKIGLVGETGAGKTTLALSILRLLPKKIGKITSGSIKYESEELLDKPESYMLGLRGRRISMIFQDPMTSLNPVKTVGDQVLEVLNLHFPDLSKEEKNAKVDEIFRLVGIPAERKFEYPHQFSGGMKQRIVIAMALIAEPELLLADEPTTALDVTIQSQILELITKLKKEKNLSIIFITHDLGVIANMADDIAVMYAGKIVEYGTVEDIFYNPKHPYTWALLASMPDLNTKEKLDAIPGTPPNMILPPKGDAFAARNKYALAIDQEQEPPMFKISETHSAKTWLMHPDAPKAVPPAVVIERIQNAYNAMKEAGTLSGPILDNPYINKGENEKALKDGTDISKDSKKVKASKKSTSKVSTKEEKNVATKKTSKSKSKGSDK